MITKKFKLGKKEGNGLCRVIALRSFGCVAKGEVGGFVEKEANLSQEGDAWVSGDAQVYGDAWVSGDARVYGNARVSGDAWVSGDARVSGNARVSKRSLCSRFNFETTAEVELWWKAEDAFEKAAFEKALEKLRNKKGGENIR